MSQDYQCRDCRFWAHRGHMVAAGGVERHYGTCTNSANDVRMSIGFEQSQPMHDMKWSWSTCAHYEEPSPPEAASATP